VKRSAFEVAVEDCRANNGRKIKCDKLRWNNNLER
jgi:hypothetical protein